MACLTVSLWSVPDGPCNTERSSQSETSLPAVHARERRRVDVCVTSRFRNVPLIQAVVSILTSMRPFQHLLSPFQESMIHRASDHRSTVHIWPHAHAGSTWIRRACDVLATRAAHAPRIGGISGSSYEMEEPWLLVNRHGSKNLPLLCAYWCILARSPTAGMARMIYPLGVQEHARQVCLCSRSTASCASA